jgi:hypothetical protein
VTALGGAGAGAPCFDVHDGICSRYPINTAYQVDVEYQRARGTAIIGGGFDFGPSPHVIGFAAFVGKRRSGHGLFVEGNLGAGVEFARLPIQLSSVTFSQRGEENQQTITVEVQPALYARAVGSIGHRVSERVDLIARASLHVASSGLSTDFISSIIGLRYHIQ